MPHEIDGNMVSHTAEMNKEVYNFCVNLLLPSARGHELKLQFLNFLQGAAVLPSARGHELKHFGDVSVAKRVGCPPREGTN